MRETINLRAKELGTTITEAASYYGCTHQNLSYMHKTNPRKFDIICLGVAALKERENETQS